MTAWHGSNALKAEVLARMLAHRKADTIIQGSYQADDADSPLGYRGCLIGCTLPRQGFLHATSWHARVEDLYGIPAPIGHLLDRIFEGLDHRQAGDFAVNSINAIPVGADLSLVASRLLLDVLNDAQHGVQRELGSGSWDATDTVIALFRRRVSGDEPTEQEWATAGHRAVEERAPYAVVNAARAGLREQGRSRDDFAEAVEDATEWADDPNKAWPWAAERFLHHLRTAPVPAVTA